MTPEFSRPVPADRIGGGGVSSVVEATQAERRAIAERLRIPAVHALRCAFTLSRGADSARGEIVARGELRAVVVQTCVVSGDDFESEVMDDFRIRFVHAGTETDTDVDEDDELPYEHGMIDLGDAAVEQLALNLDPYPRKPGAELPGEAEELRASPFAALAARKQNN